MYSDEKNTQQHQLLVELPGDMHHRGSYDHQGAPPSYEELMPATSSQTSMTSTRPILLPASSITGGLEATPPFIRAYPPILGSYGVSSSEFMTIVDSLNIAHAEPAPLKAIQLASDGVGFVPDPICQSVSLGLGLAAGTATAASAIIRSKLVLDSANRDVFGPKGLKMEIVKDTKVMQRLGATAKSLDPLQRLQELSPYVEPLSFDVEPPTRHNNVVDRISAKQASMKQAKKAKRKQKKEDKRLHKREEAATKYSYPIASIEERYDSDTEDRLKLGAKIVGLEYKILDIIAKADEKLEHASGKKVEEIEKRRMKDIEEVEKDRAKLVEKHDKAMAKLEKKSEKREEKDEKKVSKLEWLIIYSV
ncbi:uncharacterized protein B0J16DRAFT_398323 [Fusarium flagelliforme]|uniref:uncharacterized protein n=1 Tax=Fusarium flagelliforme TaxID=2675880 RepID=UPI001E8EA1D6|nr:uncharacterized protein B0J16DRAFT_398323 [Fusarium flagelliforme]KAH7184830.1 hypothetical protein B0J16DRAFT_398323 [Fusarium flagelliforme]